ncbi:hypothetical protein PHMEG_0002847 [Phytophthora megakarya]|uniref:OTU domain-containing protein n=1 Tax=Phytophthora megakarya TaxID=4795 RepID=A0A225WXN6_9STRA|nr:hypothetical protein PHMEG_0002847 [Phytophthora megakarya]
MTDEKFAAMEAYVSRKLDLPAPPTFLSCTVTGLKRAALLAFHRDHVEAALIADVPANARLGKHLSHQSILREMVTGNTSDEAGRLRMKKFISAAQRVTFDGEHTLSIIFMSKATAAAWDGATFRLRGQQIQLNAAGEQVPGIVHHHNLRAIMPSVYLERKATTPCSFCKCLPSTEPYYHATSPAAPSPMETDDVVAKTPSTPDDDLEAHGFEMGDVVASTNTYNLTFQEWIGSVAGVPVNLPANGQCLFLAFHASTENTQVQKLHITSTVEAKANVVKKQVLDIVLANLRYDIKLKVVDPKAELQRMYPGENPPSSVEAAAVALFSHYLKIRDVSVATPVPKTFWEGPHVLRAMTVYLREPIYVWDVAANDIAHAQQYAFKTFEMANGDCHETGVVVALPDDTMRDILEECFNQQVIPVMLLLKHSEGHFYGVQHGQTFIDWHTKSGPAMRSRLDAVHRKLGIQLMAGNGRNKRFSKRWM